MVVSQTYATQALSVSPRGLKAGEVAAYLGISTSGFARKRAAMIRANDSNRLADRAQTVCAEKKSKILSIPLAIPAMIAYI